MSTSDLLTAKRVRLDALLQNRVAPVLLHDLTQTQAEIYLRRLGDLLLDPRSDSKNVTYIPISQIQQLLTWLRTVREGKPIPPSAITTYHVIYQTLSDALQRQPAFQDILPRIMHNTYTTTMPRLARLPKKQMLLHAKLMVRLNLSFDEAAKQLMQTPATLWEDVLGTKR